MYRIIIKCMKNDIFMINEDIFLIVITLEAKVPASVRIVR